MIVGLVGKKRAGKDSVAARLVHHHDFARLAFADRLKAAAEDLDPLLPLPDGRIDHLSAVLHEATPRGWEGAKAVPAVREFLQDFGVTMRANIADDVWIRPVLSEAFRLSCAGRDVVITDVRFANEIQEVRSVGGLIVAVERPDLDDSDPHVSEHEWRSVTPDATVHNFGTLEDLGLSVDYIAGVIQALHH